MAVLDHIIWAAPDLEAGIDSFERLTGVRPAVAGSHPGFGTRNALASLSEGVYIEVMAPDPAQNLAGTRGAVIADLPEPRLFTFAVATDDIAGVELWAATNGLRPQRREMSRTRPDGVRLDWQVLDVDGHGFGLAMPFFIEWGTPHHPSATAPSGLALERFTVLHPEADALVALYGSAGIPVLVEPAEPGFTLVANSPLGAITLR